MFSFARSTRMVWVVAGFLVFLAGCGSDPTSPVATDPAGDDAQIRALILGNSEFAPYFVYDTSYGRPVQAPGFPISLSPIASLQDWWRESDEVSHEIDIQYEGGTATVSSTMTTQGRLILMEATEAGVVQHEKPLVDIGHRTAIFQREGDPQAGPWYLTSISGLDVESAVDGQAPTVQIESVLLEPAGEGAIEITDPLEARPRRDVLSLSPGQEVAITVRYNGVPALGFVHYGGGNAGQDRTRMPLELQPDGTFRGLWTVPSPGGVHNIIIDLLTEGSLYESEAGMSPYDSNQWGLLYNVGDPQRVDD